MAQLSITKAWNETAAFVKQDAGPLFTIAFALMVLPGVVLEVLTPRVAGGAASALLVLPVVLVMVVLSLVGSIAIASLALGRERVVGSALAHGLRRFLPLLGASLLIALAAALVAVPPVFLLGVPLEELAGPSPSPEAAARFMLLFLILTVLLLFIWVRLMVMTPVAAAEPAGPIDIIRRSWALTGGHFWKLLGFVLLFAIAFVVVAMAVTSVAGIALRVATGSTDPGTIGGLLVILISGLLNALFIVLMTSMIARIYAQLTGSTESAVFD